jgi:ABC-type amino acid transport substrate-binding protein
MSLKPVLAIVVLLAATGPAAGQEIRPTLDKIKETGVIHLGYRETSRPFSFVGSDGKPAGYSVDLCRQVVGGIRESLTLADLKVAWVAVTPGNRIPELVKGTIDLECGSTTITFSRMEEVAFSHMIFVDGGSLLATTESPRRSARGRVHPGHRRHGERARGGAAGSRGRTARRVRLGSYPARRLADDGARSGEAQAEPRAVLVRAVRSHAAPGRQRVSGERGPHALASLQIWRVGPDLRALVPIVREREPLGEGSLSSP